MNQGVRSLCFMSMMLQRNRDSVGGMRSISVMVTLKRATRRGRSGMSGSDEGNRFFRQVLYKTAAVLISVPAISHAGENDAAVSFAFAFLKGAAVYFLFIVLLGRMRKEAGTIRYEKEQPASRRIKLAVIIIRAMVLVPLFPTVIFCIAPGPSRGESAVIVSALFGIVLMFSVFRVVVTAAAGMLRPENRSREGPVRVEV